MERTRWSVRHSRYPSTTAANTQHIGRFIWLIRSQRWSEDLGGSSIDASTKRKRDRPAKVIKNEIDDDEELLQQLQEGEYRGISNILKFDSTPRAIGDSDVVEDEAESELLRIEFAVPKEDWHRFTSITGAPMCAMLCKRRDIACIRPVFGYLLSSEF